jgi:lysophospholipase
MLLTLIHLSLCAVFGAAISSPFSPSGNYTPSFVQCPCNKTFVRPASNGLGSGEQAWLHQRKSKVVPALEQYLHTAHIDDFDVGSYISCLAGDLDSAVPVIGLTLSGGGTRAQISGLGLYQAMDGRYAKAVEAGTGGLLQALTYVAGRGYSTRLVARSRPLVSR